VSPLSSHEAPEPLYPEIIVISQIPSSLPDEHLTMILGSFGELKAVDLVVDEVTGQSKVCLCRSSYSFK
jgi:hypothetical protein